MKFQLGDSFDSRRAQAQARGEKPQSQPFKHHAPHETRLFARPAPRDVHAALRARVLGAAAAAAFGRFSIHAAAITGTQMPASTYSCGALCA